MTFFEDIFHAMGTNDLWEPTVIPWNEYCWLSWCNFMVNSLKYMRMGPKVLSHSTPNANVTTTHIDSKHMGF